MGKGLRDPEKSDVERWCSEALYFGCTPIPGLRFRRADRQELLGAKERGFKNPVPDHIAYDQGGKGINNFKQLSPMTSTVDDFNMDTF